MLTRPETSEREDAIIKVRALIDDRAYQAGDRLPAERELTNELGITRTMLRRALEALEREGMIWRHVGKGTFVAGPDGGGLAGGLAGLSRQLTPVRMMRARLCIEPAIAKEAAINASAEAIVRIKLAKSKAEAAPSWIDYETHDDLFHHAIAEAADNILLRALFEQLNQVQRAVAWGRVERKTTRPPREHASFVEHARIFEAIKDHDANAAYTAMYQHIESVSSRLFGQI